MKPVRPAIFTALLVVFACPATAEELIGRGHMMSGSEISAALPGMTMTGNYGNGIKFTESYLPDGSITYKDDNGSDTGRWFVRGDLFCTFYDTYNGACYAVRQSGANCYEYYTEQEENGSQHPYEGSWNSVGWDISKPSTCDLSDKTA